MAEVKHAVPLTDEVRESVESTYSKLTLTTDLRCPLCPSMSAFNDQQTCLRHLLLSHKLVIAHVDVVPDLPMYRFTQYPRRVSLTSIRYLAYWTKRFVGYDIREFASEMHTQVTADSPKDVYYLLSDVLPEDRAVRELLKAKRLERMLKAQEEERKSAGFSRKCLFCKLTFQGSRADLINHMYRVHHFNLGRPENLVSVDELLDILEDRLERLQCLYCERTFRSHDVLRRHMRKKRHLRLDGKNRAYDKFYMINYLDSGRTWEEIAQEPDDDASDDSNSEGQYEDWQETEKEDCKCLFCETVLPNAERAVEHLNAEHKFDIWQVRLDYQLDLYGCFAMVNFIRRQVSQHRCPCCGESCGSSAALQQHLKEQDHYKVLKDAPFWKDGQYLYPFDDSDPMLTGLDFDGDDNEEGKTDEQDDQELLRMTMAAHQKELTE